MSPVVYPTSSSRRESGGGRAFLLETDRMRHKDVYTTGDVSRVCRAAVRTVAKWCDTGALSHYLVGADRRIPRESLVKFMRLHNIPQRWLDEPEETD